MSSLFRAGVTYSATLPVTGEPITLSTCVRDNAPNHITLTTSSGAKYIWIQIAKSQMQAIYSLTVIDKGTGMSYKPFAVSEVIVPCDLYEGDVWYPMTGRVERHNGIVDFATTIFARGVYDFYTQYYQHFGAIPVLNYKN